MRRRKNSAAFPPAAAVLCGTLGGLYFGGGAGGAVSGIFFRPRPGPELSLERTLGPGLVFDPRLRLWLWVLAFFTLLLLLCFFAGLWFLRRRPGHVHIRKGVGRASAGALRVYSQSQLRYRFGRPLYFLGLAALCFVSFWNGFLRQYPVGSGSGSGLGSGSGSGGASGSVLQSGEKVHLYLRVMDFPVFVVTAQGRHYQRVDCRLVAYAGDRYEEIPGNENLVVYILDENAAGLGEKAVELGENGAGLGENRASALPGKKMQWLPGDLFVTHCKTFSIGGEKEASALGSASGSGSGTTLASALGSASSPASASAFRQQSKTDFDYPAYMARRGFYHRAYVYDYKRVEGKLTAREKLLRLRVPLSAGWGQIAENADGAEVREARDVQEVRERRKRAGTLLLGICLGDKNNLGKDVRERFNAVGAGHVLAVSGLHVGALYGSFIWILELWSRLKKNRRYRFRRKRFSRKGPSVGKFSRQSGRGLSGVELQAWRLMVLKTYSVRRGTWVHVPALVLIWMYAAVVGFSTSVMRAALMLTVYGVGKLLGYRAFGLNVLSIAALLLVVIEPMYLFDLGFQLSFSAVLSLMLFFPLFRNVLSVRKTVPRYLWELFCCSLSVQVGTLWLSWGTFGILPLYALFCNMLVVPLATLILYSFMGYLVVFGVGRLLVLLLGGTAAGVVGSIEGGIAGSVAADVAGGVAVDIVGSVDIGGVGNIQAGIGKSVQAVLKFGTVVELYLAG